MKELTIRKGYNNCHMIKIFALVHFYYYCYQIIIKSSMIVPGGEGRGVIGTMS